MTKDDVHALWRRVTEGRDLDCPVQRTVIDEALRDAVAAIEDGTLRKHVAHAVGTLRRAAYGLDYHLEHGRRLDALEARVANLEAAAAAPTAAPTVEEDDIRAGRDGWRHILWAALAALRFGWR